jgi:hypothetical protein
MLSEATGTTNNVRALLSLQEYWIAKGLKMEVFAITALRRLQHPGVVPLRIEVSSRWIVWVVVSPYNPAFST